MKESTIEMYVKQIQNDEISILQVPIIYISDVAKELFNEIIENKYTNFNILCSFANQEAEDGIFGEYLSKDEREEIKKKAQEQWGNI